MMIKPLNETIQNCKFFYLFCISILVATGYLLCLITKAQSFIFLNQVRHIIMDIFFSRYTFAGDGAFTVIITIILFLTRRHKLAFCVLFAYLTSGCFSQLLKHLVYAPRPRAYFEMTGISYYINFFETSHAGNNSFPSGHTTSAFALATVLADYFRKPHHAFLLLFGAVLVGYSRIYTGEHFPLDVWTGACIGVFFGLLTKTIFRNTSISIPKLKKRKQAAIPNMNLAG